MLQEQLSIQTQHPLIAREFDYKHFTYPWHFHEEYELIYVRESEGEWFVADSTGKYGPGDLFLVGSSVPHFLRSESRYLSAETTDRVRGAIIQFESAFMSHSIQNYAELLPVKKMLENSRLGLLLPSSAAASCGEFMDSIPKMEEIDRIAAVLHLLVLLSQKKEIQSLGSPAYTPSLKLFKDARMEKVQAYLLHHYTESVNLDIVASQAAMNPSAFCRYFKEKSGKTLIEYIITLRIGFAKQLLIAGKENISSVALTCGFNSLSSFNRNFKLLVGLTPTEYCRKYLE